jgi:anti-anti-sigma regulatory factor
MLRITETDTDGETTKLILEGRIIGQWVSEIRNCCEAALSEKRNLILDLSRVNFVDEQGLEVLKDLSRKKVRLTGCSIFLSELLAKV